MKLKISLAIFCSIVIEACSGDDGKDGINGLNGADGKDGINGSSCLLEPLEDESGFTVYCGDEIVGYLHNGRDGADGKDGVDGMKGEKGDVGDTGPAGEKGMDGINGLDGADGKNCEMRDTTDANDEKRTGVIISCGSVTRTLWGAPQDGSSSNLGKLPTCDEEYDSSTQICVDGYVYNMCGSRISYDPRTEFCYDDILYLRCGGKTFDPLRQYCRNDVVTNFGLMRDLRDDRLYKTAWINDQNWMIENLNYGLEGSFCYNNDENNCATYGRLYVWNDARNVCPEGWHLPTGDEFEVLLAYTNKHIRNNSWKNGDDEFNFSLLPAGYRNFMGRFYDWGSFAYLWSSSGNGSSNAFRLNVNGSDAYIESHDKDYAFSIRCLRD